MSSAAQTRNFVVAGHSGSGKTYQFIEAISKLLENS